MKRKKITKHKSMFKLITIFPALLKSHFKSDLTPHSRDGILNATYQRCYFRSGFLASLPRAINIFVPRFACTSLTTCCINLLSNYVPLSQHSLSIQRFPYSEHSSLAMELNSRLLTQSTRLNRKRLRNKLAKQHQKFLSRPSSWNGISTRGRQVKMTRAKIGQRHSRTSSCQILVSVPMQSSNCSNYSAHCLNSKNGRHRYVALNSSKLQCQRNILLFCRFQPSFNENFAAF